MQRIKLENGDFILVREIFTTQDKTIALITKKRRYGVWDIQSKRWIDGPFRRMKDARMHFDAHLLTGLKHVAK